MTRRLPARRSLARRSLARLKPLVWLCVAAVALMPTLGLIDLTKI